MDNVAEEYPLPTAPTFPVMWHPDTRKWFAIIMDVPKDKLGLIGQQRVDVINVAGRIFQRISFYDVSRYTGTDQAGCSQSKYELFSS